MIKDSKNTMKKVKKFEQETRNGKFTRTKGEKYRKGGENVIKIENRGRDAHWTHGWVHSGLRGEGEKDK